MLVRVLLPTLVLTLSVILPACGKSQEHAKSSKVASQATQPSVFVGRDAKRVREELVIDFRERLETASEFELLALDPTRLHVPTPVIRDDAGNAADGDGTDPADDAGDEEFHGYRVLGRAVIVDADERRALIEAFYEGINAWGGEDAECFSPRHGIRLSDGSDFVICFECQLVDVRRYSDSALLTFIHIDPVAEPVFDAAFKRHGLKKARRKGAPK